MKFSREMCLGGRINNKNVTGIRYGGHKIFPLFDFNELYNEYTIHYSTGDYTTSVVKKDCVIDYELRTDWGDGTIDNESTHVYADTGYYTIRSNGFLDVSNYNGSRLILSKYHIRPDIIDGSRLFYNFKNSDKNVTTFPEHNHPTFKNLSIDTSYMTNMSYMFYNCFGIYSDTAEDAFDLSDWNTSKVTDMSYMFYGCENMFDLIVHNWNTSKVTNMSYMFYNCENVLSFNLSNWDTSNVIDMSYMFCSCNRLGFLDLRNFDMTNVTNTNNMFSGCANLVGIRLDDCDYDTIRKIITSENFPTNTTYDGDARIYCKEENIGDLLPPTNWKFYNCLTNEEIIIE